MSARSVYGAALRLMRHYSPEHQAELSSALHGDLFITELRKEHSTYLLEIRTILDVIL